MSDITLFNFESDYCCQGDLNNWDGMTLVDEKWNYWDGMTLVDEKWNPYENAYLIDRLIIAEFCVSGDKRNDQQYKEVKANRPETSKQDTGIMGNQNDYDFTRPGAEDGLPVQHRDRKDTNKNDPHRKNIPTPGEFCSADGIIYQEKLWVPLMNAMQASIDLAYECDQIPEEKTALDEVISLLMLSSPPTAILVSQISTLVKLYSKRTRLLPSQLKEENILRAVRSCASNIHWQRAAGGYYDCGNTGEKPFTMMYTDGVSGAHPLGVPTVMVSFPGMCFSRVEDWVNILSGFAKELPGTGIFGHKGFVTSAVSVEPQLEAFLKELNLTPGSYQIVFCGHSMGGAVAALSAISYATKHPVVEKNNVLVYTMGQPKTIKDGYAEAVDTLIPPQNHIRMLAYSGSVCDPDLPESLHLTPTSDFVGGYLESRVDTIRCCHVGTEYPLDATVALPYGRLSLHLTSAYWSAMHSNARSRFDDASVVYHHSGKFTNVAAIDAVDAVDAVITAVPIVTVDGAADISVSAIGTLHDTNPTNTTTAATNAHTNTSTDTPTTTNCSFNTSSNANTPSGEHDSCQMWSCCSSPFADESGCVRGVQTQHAGEWNYSESYWTCCQTAGVGLRYVSGCSLPYALQVLTESQAKYNQMSAAYSEEVNKCHRMQGELKQCEYDGDLVSKRDEALYAMSQRECLRLNTAAKAADIALNEAYYSWTRATLLAEMQTVSGEKESIVDQKMHAHTIDSTGLPPCSAHFLDAIDAGKRLQQRLHLVALLFTHKAALDRAEEESMHASRYLQRASTFATECSAVLAASQKTVQSSRALMVARAAAVEAVRTANWEVQMAKQSVKVASDKVSRLRKSFNAAVGALNANKKAESLGNVGTIEATASDHRVAVEIAKRSLDLARAEVINASKPSQNANSVYLAAKKELDVCNRLQCRKAAEIQRKSRAVAAFKSAEDKCTQAGQRSQEASDRMVEAQRVYDAAVAAEIVFNK